MAQKSKMYYTTRSAIRGLVKVLMLLAVYFVLHLATYSIWTAALFVAVVVAGFTIHDHKMQLATSHVQ